jgi:transcriptional regulator of acetoin/glycerol metabolism
MAFQAKDNEMISTREMWDSFIKKGIISECSLRPDILRSWQRCKGIDPNIDAAHNKYHLSDELLNEKRANNQELISAAEPVLNEICSIGGQYFVLLSDNNGYNLIAKSNVDYPLPIGAKCCEENIGTNAIGLALVEDRLVEVKGCEHYTSSLHSFSCSAIPIHDAAGKILGIICVANPYGELQPVISGVLKLSMQAIESQLKLKYEQIKYKQACSMLELLMNSIEQYALVIDKNGKVVDINEKCLHLLGIENKNKILGIPYYVL